MIASFLLLNLNTWYQRRRILSSKVQMSPLTVYNSRSGTLCNTMAEALSGALHALKNKLHHGPHERFLTNIYSNNNTLELSLDWNLVISTTWKCCSITFIWMVADKCFVHGIKVCHLNNHTLIFNAGKVRIPCHSTTCSKLVANITRKFTGKVTFTWESLLPRFQSHWGISSSNFKVRTTVIGSRVDTARKKSFCCV